MSEFEDYIEKKMDAKYDSSWDIFQSLEYTSSHLAYLLQYHH
jgi:hypothetical protein